MKELRAYRHNDHYIIIGKRTYYIKDKLKNLGARAEKKGTTWLWHTSREVAEQVGADFQVRARVSARCHMPEAIWIVSHLDAIVGKKLAAGCPMCDLLWGQTSVTVLEVLGEYEWPDKSL